MSNKKGFVLFEAMISFLIIIVTIEFCFSFIIWAKRIRNKLISQMETRYKTKSKLEEILNKDYDLISSENGVEVVEIKQGLKLIKVSYVPYLELISIKNGI